MDSIIKDCFSFLNNFADESGEILRKKFNESFQINIKDDGSMVTEVDQMIETLFLEKIKKKFNGHGVLGEEYGSYNKNSEFKWIIDPLDGTHSFISGKPLFGTLICLTVKDIPTLGLIDIPILKERWIGGKNIAVKKNNSFSKINPIEKKLNECIVSSTSLLMFNEEHETIIKEIYEKVKFPVFGTDCYAYGLLISGKIDLIIEENMKPWDYMAQVPLIEEVGGIITDWNGDPLNVKSCGQVIASQSRRSHEEVLNYLSRIKHE